METGGVVREWHRDEGWGVIDSAETPGGCQVSFGHIAADGYRELTPGQLVTLQWEHVDQDGYRFRAVKVGEADAEPWEARTSRGTAMGSTLTITFSPDADDEGPEATRHKTP